MTNVCGVRDEVAMTRTDLEVDDIAEPTSRVDEYGRGITSDRWQHAEDRKSSRARRQRPHRMNWLSHLLNGVS
jgi:hypothetical protein